jgi:ubiquinone/menaquinone biosynthesis C-methylase UbiE
MRPTQGEESFGFVKSRLYALTARWRRKFIEFVANDIKSRNPKSVLDIGCGTGEILDKLTNLGIELYGIDPSPFMLDLSKKRIRDSNPTGHFSVNLSLGNSRVIPFDRQFDLIFSYLSFHHWNDRDRNIPTILERLNENGEFRIYEYDRNAMSYPRRLIMGKHALSENEVKEIKFNGYAERIEHTGSVIIVEFKKEL